MPHIEKKGTERIALSCHGVKKIIFLKASTDFTFTSVIYFSVKFKKMQQLGGKKPGQMGSTVEWK